jgi:photosystem II stability/assembly factor-like uncharacterized protein
MRTIAAKTVACVWVAAMAASILLAADHRSVKLDIRTKAQQGQAHAWQSVGPAPPAIGAAIAAHAPSHTIYIVGEGRGVLKSTDGGTTFVTVNNEITGAVSMVMDPNDPNVVYTGGFKTTDGGVTWVDMAQGAGIALAMDPTNSNILYTDLDGGVEKTVDGGVTWETVSQGWWSAAIWSLVINPFDPNVLFVGSNGDGAFKSIDGGATWTSLDIDSTVWGLFVDPDDGNIVYAGSNGDGVYKSTDGGDSFARVGSPDVGVVFSIIKSGNRLYAGTAGGGVSVSEDGGVTWTNTGVSQSQGLILSVDSTGSVYLGTNFDGAFVLPAGDHATWRRLAWDQLKTCACQLGHALAIDPSNHNHIFFTTNDGGLLVTEDGGLTWQDGGTHGFVARAPRAVAFDPRQPSRVYGSSIAGGLFKSEDGGKHWQRRRFGSSTNYTTGISVDPVDHSVYVATFTNLGITTNGIWKSTDFGKTFTRIDRAPHARPGQFLDLSGRGITVDPHRHRTIYFADRSSGIWRSRNAGATWRRVDATPVFSVTVDPTDSNIVYAGTRYDGVLKSTDGGSSFTKKNNRLSGNGTSRTGSVQIDPSHPNVLYVGTEGNGVFKSTDGAETWFRINFGLDDLDVTGFAMAPGSPNILYAATQLSSVYKKSTEGR